MKTKEQETRKMEVEKMWETHWNAAYTLEQQIRATLKKYHPEASETDVAAFDDNFRNLYSLFHAYADFCLNNGHS